MLPGARSMLCMGSGHIGQDLLSDSMSSQPVLVELLWRLIAQCLMVPGLFVDPVPGKQGGLKSAQVGRQILDLAELLLVGAEGTLYLAIALGIVRPVEVVEKLQLPCRQPNGLSDISS